MWGFTDHTTGRIVGCTTVQQQTPLWGWTEQELAEPADYLYSTGTDHVCSLLALWSVGRAARSGRSWVRQGCMPPTSSATTRHKAAHYSTGVSAPTTTSIS
ncbi:hypothetical protein AB0B79_01885 [Streptomyces sp. NPDC039022]|uniref:hypothetical protein n=1 Tax=unclassified Streptomyces TaxID=2593676 RepID=UPI0033F9F69F